MSQFSPLTNTPPVDDSSSPKPPIRRTNGWAIASLACGIIGCVPMVTSVAAIILGVVGFRKARKSGTETSLAMAGLVLGIVGVVGWGLLSIFMLTAYTSSKPARAVAHQFALDLSTGNIPAASASTAGMTPQQLAPVVAQMKPWGALTSASFTRFGVRKNIDGTTTCDLGGNATFAVGGPKIYTVTLVKRGGNFQVYSFNFR